MANLAPDNANKVPGTGNLETDVLTAGKAAALAKFKKELNGEMKSCENDLRKELSNQLKAEHGLPSAPDREVSKYDPQKFAAMQHDFKAAQKENKDIYSSIEQKAKADAHLQCTAERKARLQEKEAELEQVTAKLLKK
ncbi:MAG: hypothetical protein PHC51_02070 [bacterium]|nr:hypothetical protein [bacterium]